MKRKAISWKTRWQVYQRGNGVCHICGRQLDFIDSTVDHITPVSAGGTDDLSNLMPAHHSCNASRGSGEPRHYPPTLQRLDAFMAERNISRRELASALGYNVISLHKMFCGSASLGEAFVGKFFLTFGPDATNRVFGETTQEATA